MKRSALKRGTSVLERRTPLATRTPLAPGGPLKRSPLKPGGGSFHGGSAIPRRSSVVPATSRRDTGPGQGVRALVALRDGNRCVRCNAPATNQHHRLNRGQGGSSDPAINSPANLVSVCGQGNLTGCHGWIENNKKAAEALGLIVLHGIAKPADVPVFIRGCRVLLNHDGSVTALGRAA